MKQILYRLFEHQYLGREEARNILQNIAEGRYNDSQIASLITVFLMRSISVEELTGFREALLEMRVPVDLSDDIECPHFPTLSGRSNILNMSYFSGKIHYTSSYSLFTVQHPVKFYFFREKTTQTDHFFQRMTCTSTPRALRMRWPSPPSVVTSQPVMATSSSSLLPVFLQTMPSS